MAKLICCKGLPASGKSTWAWDQVTTNRKHLVVEKDEIRLTLEKGGWTWSPKAEQEVIDERDSRIKAGLKLGWTVISADTNLAPKHEKRLRELALDHNADFEIKSFDVHVAECIRRDSLREGKAKVGEKVIMDMYNKYMTPHFNMETPPPMVPYTLNPTLPSIVLVDLDGTLCLHNNRGPFEYHKCDTDKVNFPVLFVLDAVKLRGVGVVYMSGREDSCKEKTSIWLKDNNCPPGDLYMRKSGDYRKDSLVKYALFNTHIRGQFNVLFCLDDRQQVVDFYRSIGLTVFQVAPGDF